MPNRILKESICISEDIAQLSWFEEVLFYRLIVSADDFGRYDGRPAIIKGRLFPLTGVTTKQIDEALKKLASVGIVALYEIDGHGYLQISAWERHQSPRAKKSKYPAPPEKPSELESTCIQMQADEIQCKHISPINDNGNDTRYTISDIRDDAKPKACESKKEPVPEPVILLPLNDKSLYPVIQSQVDEWSGLYPAVNVMQELRKMAGWLDANPSKRKTKRGILRFVNGWLSREQDRGGSKKPSAPPKQETSFDLDEYERTSSWGFFEEGKSG